MNVLIVEDDPDLAQVLADIVEMLDGKPRMARHAAAAMQMLQQEIPNLMLLDFNLPGINGIEFLCSLKRGVATRDIQVVFISCDDNPETIRSAKEAGARSYFVKPVDIDDLTKVMESVRQKTSWMDLL